MLLQDVEKDTKIRKSFSRAAKTYEGVAHTQAKSAVFLVKALKKKVKINISTILDVGAETGFATEALLSIFPHAIYTLNDISQEMLFEASQKFLNFRTIGYLLGDAEVVSFLPFYNLWTNIPLITSCFSDP